MSGEASVVLACDLALSGGLRWNTGTTLHGPVFHRTNQPQRRPLEAAGNLQGPASLPHPLGAAVGSPLLPPVN